MKKIIESDVADLLFGELATILSIIIGVLEPGVLSVFLFKPFLFGEYDIIKILILSICISVPSFTLFVFSSITNMALFDNNPNILSGNKDRRQLIFMSSIGNALLFNILLIAKIINRSFSARSFAICIIVFSILFLILSNCFMVYLFNKKK